MVEDTPQQVSREAHDRMTKERDDAKQRVMELEAAVARATEKLGEIDRIDDAHAHFASKELPDPYSLAKAAVLNPQVQGAEASELAAALDGWYDQSAKLFGGSTPTPEPETPPVAPMTQPNPVAPGEPVVGGAPLVLGSAEYEKQYGHLSWPEQRAALERGEVVVPEAVKAAQSTLG